MHPESGRPRELHQASIPDTIALRCRRYATIDRIKYGRIRVIHAKPQNTTNRIHDPIAQLSHQDKSGLLCRDRTLVRIFLSIYLITQRTPAIRSLERSGSRILCHIQIRSLIMITHTSLHVAHGDLAIRLDIKRHRFLCRITLDKVGIAIHRGVELTEERPDPRVASPQASEIIRAIGFSETEILILSREITFLAGKRDHVR